MVVERILSVLAGKGLLRAYADAVGFDHQRGKKERDVPPSESQCCLSSAVRHLRRQSYHGSGVAGL